MAGWFNSATNNLLIVEGTDNLREIQYSNNPAGLRYRTRTITFEREKWVALTKGGANAKATELTEDETYQESKTQRVDESGQYHVLAVKKTTGEWGDWEFV